MSSDTPPAETGADRDAAIDVPISVDGQTTIPLARAVMGRGFLTGKSGSGKSNSVGVLLEEILDRGVPALIVDTDGEHVALKEEYELLHVGASAECDVTVDVDNVEQVADTVLDRRVPTILDTSEFFGEETVTDLVANVARRLFVREKSLQKPTLLVLEEAHEFIPQKGKNDAKEVLTKVAKRGRKRGLGIVGLSQRPADVAKSFITQCDWMAIHRLTWPNDTQVVRDVTDAATAEAVEELATGESFVVADWERSIQRVQWRRKETPDYGDSPPIELALGESPDEIGRGVFADYEDGGDEDSDDVDDGTRDEPLGTYSVHHNSNGSGYAQIGRPVAHHLGFKAGQTATVEFHDDHLIISINGENADAEYSIFHRSGRDYSEFTLGAKAVSALGAEPGDTLRVDDVPGEDVIRIEIENSEGNR